MPIPMKHPSILILTGAGISAESGLPTFRDKDGLWEGHRFEDVASPEAFRRNPELVHRFYNLRRAALIAVQPNAAHLAIAKLQQRHAGKVSLVTQNVDDLHERAGSSDVIHMHGELRKVRCTLCGDQGDWLGDLGVDTPCPACSRSGGMRPDIVWFGEIPYHMDVISDLLDNVDLFVSIGTSGHVYPAAGFVSAARFAGAETIEINNAETMVSASFDRHLTGPATIEVVRWVEEILTGKSN
jgi:NAD-dependent deacetylase